MCPSTEAPAAEPRRLGSYTTAKVTTGRVERLEQHVARLRRDAVRLALPRPPARDAERLVLETARAEFGRGDGIIRLEWSHRPGQAPALRATPRAFVRLPTRWRAARSRATHPGPARRANTKHVDVPAYDQGRDEVASSEIQEVLLFDADGFLVEGSRSNLLVVTEDGRLVTPALALGGVEGLGLEVVRHGRSDVREAHLTRDDVAKARELMSVNAVRGVVPIVELDGRAVAEGEPGPHSAALNAIFSA